MKKQQIIQSFLESNKNDCFIDIHTHNNYSNSTIFAIQNIFAQDVKPDISVSNCFFSIGIHPWHSKEINLEKAISNLKKSISSENIIALGECGLDYVKRSENQLEIFEKQIKISEKNRTPMIIHCVKAYSDILFLRKKTKAKQSWILHGFNGNLQLAKQLIQSGCYLSFGEILLNSKSKAAKIFCEIPEASFFLETDESKFEIEQIYKKASELKEINLLKLKHIIIQNFKNIFLKNE